MVRLNVFGVPFKDTPGKTAGACVEKQFRWLFSTLNPVD